MGGAGASGARTVIGTEPGAPKVDGATTECSVISAAASMTATAGVMIPLLPDARRRSQRSRARCWCCSAGGCSSLPLRSAPR
jgi:hypothetical protein